MREAYQSLAPRETAALYELSKAIADGSLDAGLRELVAVAVSQLNRCAHCIEVHWKKALSSGVAERKLRLLSAFRETAIYEERERVALELAEQVTLLSRQGVSEELWERVRQSFSREEERMQLLYQIILMNSWNRLSVTLALDPPS